MDNNIQKIIKRLEDNTSKCSNIELTNKLKEVTIMNSYLKEINNGSLETAIALIKNNNMYLDVNVFEYNKLVKYYEKLLTFVTSIKYADIYSIYNEKCGIIAEVLYILKKNIIKLESHKTQK